MTAPEGTEFIYNIVHPLDKRTEDIWFEYDHILFWITIRTTDAGNVQLCMRPINLSWQHVKTVEAADVDATIAAWVLPNPKDIKTAVPPPTNMHAQRTIKDLFSKHKVEWRSHWESSLRWQEVARWDFYRRLYDSLERKPGDPLVMIEDRRSKQQIVDDEISAMEDAAKL